MFSHHHSHLFTFHPRHQRRGSHDDTACLKLKVAVERGRRVNLNLSDRSMNSTLTLMLKESELLPDRRELNLAVYLQSLVILILSVVPQI